MSEPTRTLNTLAEYRRGVERLEQRMRALVAQARAEGASWEQIGHALNITKQAAQQRFGKTN